MTGQYKGNDLQWRPIATVTGGGPSEKSQFDASTGRSMAGSYIGAVLFAGDEIWGNLEPVAVGVDLTGAFGNMLNITTVPHFDTSNVTTMAHMFRNCSSLTTVPQLDTSSVTTTAHMFRDCPSLTTVPEFNTSNVTTMINMFAGCSSLATVPQLDTGSVTTMASMFYDCSSLATVTQLDTSSVTTMTSMFMGCRALTEVPALDMSLVTTNHSATTNPFGQLGTTSTQINTQLQSCTRFRAFGATRTFGINGTLMGAEALNELMTNLGTAVSGATLNIQHNPGSATCDPSIATAKGWTVLT